MSVCAIIPARSGSKTVKDKNIRTMCGKPMLAWSIEQAQAASEITRVIVSTDSEKYAKIAQEYGAETPFIRPASVSMDATTDLETFQHALCWLQQHEGGTPDIIVHLRPTHPVRYETDIDKAVQLLRETPDADSVRSVVAANENPYKMWTLDEGGMLRSIVSGLPECYNLPRQSLPFPYYQNACIDVVRAQTILQKNSMTGDCVLGYPMQYNFDVDTEQDFLRAEQALSLQQAERSGLPRTFCFDIDGVIASLVLDGDYNAATPMADNIAKIRRLFGKNHKIILFTARGYVTGLDWCAVTEKQMRQWAVPYHELHFGKPAADFYVDDKMISIFNL